MRKFTMMILAVSLTAIPAVAEVQKLDEIRTTLGRLYSQCRVTQVHPDGISFIHQKGAAKVLFDELDDSIRQRFGYDAEKARQYAAELSERREAERERIAKAKSEQMERQLRLQEAQLKVMEQALLMQSREQQRQLANMYQGMMVPVTGPAPAVGWPGNYYGPTHPIGAALGGPQWTRRGRVTLASIGGGSGGYLRAGFPGFVRLCGGGVWTSPTLGSYVPGVFAPFGRTGPFGGVYLGGGRSVGFSGGFVGYGGGFSAPCGPVIGRGSVALPVAAP